MLKVEADCLQREYVPSHAANHAAFYESTNLDNSNAKINAGLSLLIIDRVLLKNVLTLH